MQGTVGVSTPSGEYHPTLAGLSVALGHTTVQLWPPYRPLQWWRAAGQGPLFPGRACCRGRLLPERQCDLLRWLLPSIQRYFVPSGAKLKMKSNIQKSKRLFTHTSN